MDSLYDKKRQEEDIIWLGFTVSLAGRWAQHPGAHGGSSSQWAMLGRLLRVGLKLRFCSLRLYMVAAGSG